ncbi:SpiroCoCo family coiled-coil protein [Leptospira barantonii]|uniref:Chromosome segregation protein SMC n=1 Tax=Leptospira barantonii TaxID=2023184 RepID=A0ABX4NK63_9LEPT|nr:chromosome segregation protein SMC [Leptospira barantonii]PJZ56669.1 chromosome segregation protein SMC [Leptospira barantonii]
MGIELLLPFIASVGITILLRRLDKSNYKLSQIKRFTGKVQDELNDIALEKIQFVKDAGIDLEISLKQTRKLANDVHALNEESRQLLDSIKTNRDFLDSVARDLKEVVQLSSDIREESNAIQQGLLRMESGKKEIQLLDQKILDLRSEAEAILEVFTDKVNLRSDELLQSLASKIVELEELLEIKNDKIDQGLNSIAANYRDSLDAHSNSLMRDSVGRIEQLRSEISSLFETIRNKEEDLDLRSEKLQTVFLTISDKLERLDSRVEEKAEAADRKLEEMARLAEKSAQEKLDRILEQVTHSKEAFINGVKLEVDSIRREIEGMSLETMTRRDEILNETRRQAESINESIQFFQEKYLEAENKLLRQADARKSELLRQIDTFEEEFNRISSNLRTDADGLKKDISMGLREFHSALDSAREDAKEKTIHGISNLKEEFDLELSKLHSERSTLIQQDLEAVRQSIVTLDKQISSRIKDVDSYLGDLQSAMESSAGDLMSQVEEKIDLLSGTVDEEVRKIDQRFENLSRYWEEELGNIRLNAQDQMGRLQEKLGDVHVEGKGLLEEFKNEYAVQKDKIEEFVSRYKTNFQKEGDSVSERLGDSLRNIKEDGNEILQTLREEFSGTIDKMEQIVKKNEKVLEIHAEKIRNSVESNLENAGKDAERVLDRLRDSAEDFFEKQEEKISRLNGTIDAKISKQLTSLMDKGQLQLGQLEERISKYILDVKKNLEDSLKASRKDSDDQMKGFQKQLQNQLREMEAASEEFLRSGKEEFKGSMEEYRELQLDLKRDLEEIANAKKNLIAEIQEESENLRSSVEEITDKMEELGEKAELFHKASEVVDKTDSYIQTMEELLSRADERTPLLNELEQKLDELQNLKHSLVNETEDLKLRLDSLASIKDSSDSLRNEFEELQRRSSDWEDTFTRLLEAGEKALEMEETFGDLTERLESLESVRGEVKGLFEETDAHKEAAKGLTNKLYSLQNDVEILEAREKEIAETVRKTDDRIESLFRKKEEIRSVEAKFEKIEDLMVDLSERHKQISTLQHRMEDLKAGAIVVKEDLEGLLGEADDKFEKLSGFLDAVGAVTEGSPSSSKSKDSSKDHLIQRKKATVLNLYHNFQWPAETIAEKLNLETGLVNTILQSESVKKK